ncbi:MAG TPA: toll/interleukin-1 receptor domain-containing protein [Verrucomicrobiae bacterium]
MANAKHLEILNRGVDPWNKWRRENKEIRPDLSGAELDRVDLGRADLSGTNLNAANLRWANLNLADLSGADFSRADLTAARCREANLTRACLGYTNLSSADLSEANFTGAALTVANLHDTDLSAANFNQAILVRARISEADLSGTNFSQAVFFATIMANVDLSQAKGLEAIRHLGPSSIGLDTLMQSKGKIPEVFLRGAGVPDIFLQSNASLLGRPMEFYSVFICYSTENEDFASRLYNDFHTQGIRCWKWDQDACTGRSLWGEIDSAILSHDKLVLIATKSSLTSPPVNREIERALVQEDDRMRRKIAGDASVDCDVLFPVRLDDFIFNGWAHERKVDVTKKVIADARGWDKDGILYRRVLDRLLRDLKRKSPP